MAWHPLSGALIGFVAGTALQLQQTSLFSWGIYGLLVLSAFAVLTWALLKNIPNRSHWVLTGFAFCLMAFGLTGLRASGFSQTALDPALEGRDLVVTGVVAAMPQASETSLRFRLNVESAKLKDQIVRLPPRIYLGWYSGSFDGARLPTDVELPRSPAKVIAGERWQFTVRLKAPHGASNPFGFDYELWLWEQGLQASGSVRTGAKVTPPKRLAGSPLYCWKTLAKAGTPCSASIVLRRPSVASAVSRLTRVTCIEATIVCDRARKPTTRMEVTTVSSRSVMPLRATHGPAALSLANCMVSLAARRPRIPIRSARNFPRWNTSVERRSRMDGNCFPARGGPRRPTRHGAG